MALVMIHKDTLEQLKEDSNFLRKLRAAGVDNWEGYQHAQEMED